MHRLLRALTCGTVLSVAIGVGVPAQASTAAAPPAPTTSDYPLSAVSASGILTPGATDGSTSTAQAREQAAGPQPTAALPGALLSPAALAGIGERFTQAVTSHARGLALALGAPGAGTRAVPSAGGTGGSQAEASAPDLHRKPAGTRTGDGVTIAALSDVVDLPADSPSVIGVLFDDSDVRVEFEVRTKTADGWSDWTHLHATPEGGGAEGGESSGGGSTGTDPYYVTGAQQAQLRILGDGGVPKNARAFLVDPHRLDSDAKAVADNAPTLISPGAEQQGAGESQGSAEPGAGEQRAYQVAPMAARASAVAAKPKAGAKPKPAAKSKAGPVQRPKFASRKNWGASGPKDKPRTADKVKAAVIHHTDGNKDYSPEDVPAILRGIQTFHKEGRGWSDIGYNMLADKYGRLWEGRAGGIDKPVIGAHASEVNNGTFGISVIGDYAKTAPPKKTRDAVAGAVAWKLSLGKVPAQGTTSVEGKKIKTIVGHRDVGDTDCPGDAFYATFDEIRRTAADIQQGKKTTAGAQAGGSAAKKGGAKGPAQGGAKPGAKDGGKDGGKAKAPKMNPGVVPDMNAGVQSAGV